MEQHTVLHKNNDVDLIKWRQLLTENQFTSVFQSPEFYDLYNSTDGYSAEVFAIENENKYVALCVVTLQKETGLKGYFSRRAIVYGGPLIGNGKYITELLNFITKSISAKAIYTEVRNYFDYGSYDQQYRNAGWNFNGYLNFHLNLENTSFESLLDKMKYNRKREIRISKEENASYREAVDLNEVSELYNILNDLYKTRVKLPLPTKKYFEDLFRSSIGKVFIVLHNGKIIGGSFCLFFAANRIYTLYYCGLREYHKKIFPTHLAICAAINFGIDNNLKMLDLMGAGKPGEEYGVRKYKAEFGGNLVEHGRYIKINKPVLFKIGKLGLKLIQSKS